jgi:hypothetical protein
LPSRIQAVGGLKFELGKVKTIFLGIWISLFLD